LLFCITPSRWIHSLGFVSLGLWKNF